MLTTALFTSPIGLGLMAFFASIVLFGLSNKQLSLEQLFGLALTIGGLELLLAHLHSLF